MALILPDQERLSIRPVSQEEAFRNQNDRVSYLRSLNQPWAEAVFELRDTLHGIEDKEFFDGIPDRGRQLIAAIEDRIQSRLDAGGDLDPEEQAKVNKLKDEIEEIRARWKPHGWDGMPMRAFPGPKGQPIYRPTPSDLSNALRIIRRLANRKGITWRKKVVTDLPQSLNGFEHDEEV